MPKDKEEDESTFVVVVAEEEGFGGPGGGARIEVQSHVMPRSSPSRRLSARTFAVPVFPLPGPAPKLWIWWRNKQLAGSDSGVHREDTRV